MPAPNDIPPMPSLDQFRATAESPKLPKTITIFGQTGSGKTTIAGTLFDDLTEALNGNLPKELLILKGAIWLGADEDSTVALRARRLQPEYVLDIRELREKADRDFQLVQDWLFALLRDATKAGGTTLVWDTATSYGAFLESWYVNGKGCPTSVRTGNPDTIKGWGLVGSTYRRLYEEASALGLRQIVLCHPKSNKVEEEADAPKASVAARAKAIVQGAPGDNLVVPALSGRMFGIFLQGAASIQAWMDVEDVNGERIRKLALGDVIGVQTKNRYEGILDKREPPDLRALDAKISKL